MSKVLEKKNNRNSSEEIDLLELALKIWAESLGWRVRIAVCKEDEVNLATDADLIGFSVYTQTAPAVYRVSDKLRRAPDMDALMKVAVGELSRILGPDRTFIRFGSEAELGVTQARISGHGEAAEPVEPPQLEDDLTEEMLPDRTRRMARRVAQRVQECVGLVLHEQEG